MGEIAGWVAPAATMIAAMMTAANLGGRITGWGFVVFTMGSLAWAVVGMTTGQTNLLLTNGFLLAVNLFGVWRWLGREAAYEDGSKRAARRSAVRAAPTLFAAGSLAGAHVAGRRGESVGRIVEAMLRCDGGGLAYLVVARGGVGGVGETLHAVAPGDLAFGPEGVTTTLSAEQLARLPALDADQWPVEPAELAPA